MRRSSISKQRQQPTIETLGSRTLLSAQSVSGSVIPSSEPITLHLAESTAPGGDYVAVRGPRVTLDGTATPGATVQLELVLAPHRLARLARTTVDAQGVYHFRILCPMGTTSLVAQTSGPSGVATTASLVVNRANEAIVWNTVALQAVRTAHAQAPDAARDDAIVALSVFDAVNAIHPRYTPYAAKQVTAAGASADAAVSTAAYTALLNLFPAQKPMLDAELASSLAAIPAGRSRSAGVALGASDAEQILALRASDGSAARVAYNPTPGPDVWTPTPPTFGAPVDPQWGAVTLFGPASSSQSQVPPPPAPTSAEFAAEVAQVELVGGAESTARTADQTALARFWSDLAGTFDPPGHWNQIADLAAMSHHSSLEASAHTLALVDIALADAGIEAWGIKYQDDTARPVRVIRDGLGGINPLITADASWTPLWSTPSFPSYVSGHSTFSAAAAAVLDSVYGDEDSFTDPGDPSLNLAPRHFASFDAAAQEAGISRIYGGIHFESDNLAGLALGGAVGRSEVSHELRPLVSN